MRYIHHVGSMIFGYFLYILAFKIFDVHPDNRFFCKALPYMGYWGYHPKELRWWKPAQKI